MANKANPKTTVTKSSDEIIQEISAVLAESSGEFIKDIANRVLSHPVEYTGDDLFEMGEQLLIGDSVLVESVNNNPPFDFKGIVIGFKDDSVQVRDQDDDVFDVDYIQCKKGF